MYKSVLNNQRLKEKLAMREALLNLPPKIDFSPNQHAVQHFNSQTNTGYVFKFDKKKLQSFLRKNGKYSDKHRHNVWSHFLNMPLVMDQVFEQLASKGIGQFAENIGQQYPIKNPQLLQSMTQVLSLLGNLCPLFAQSKSIPAMIFPFVKIFGKDLKLCFETVLSVLGRFCQHFFLHFPSPPFQFVQAVQEITSFLTPDLIDHLNILNLSSTEIVWPLVETLFSQNLRREDWLGMMDFLVSNQDKPEILVYFAVAWLIYHKQLVLRIQTKEGLQKFVKREGNPEMSRLYKLVEDMISKDLISITGLKFTKPVLVDQTGQYSRQIIQYSHQNVKQCWQNRMSEQVQLQRLRKRTQVVAGIHSHMRKVVDKEKRQIAIHKKMIQWNNQKGTNVLARKIQTNITDRVSNLQNLIKTVKDSLKQNVDLRNSISTKPSQSGALFKKNQLSQLNQIEDLESKATQLISKLQDVTRSNKVMSKLIQSVPNHQVLQTTGPHESALRAELLEYQQKLKDLQQQVLIKQYERKLMKS